MACSFEAEMKATLDRGHWPEAASAELRAHAASCRACRETALLTAAFRGARTAAMGAAVMEPAGLVWWRAQLRKRRAAIETVERPVRRAQRFAALLCLTVAVVVIALEVRGGVTLSPTVWLTGLWGTLGMVPVVVGGALLVALCGAAVYLTVERD